jgi:MarR family transcriptional regulator, transcriptional regulator for hemolysin
MESSAPVSPVQLINRIARLSARWLEPQLQKLGLAVAQVPVFGAIERLGPLPQKELARLLCVEQPTIAQLLSRMERDGLIVRAPDPNDGRSSLINLTPMALERAEPAREMLAEGREIAFRTMSTQEIETLCQLLQRVLTNIETALGE